MSSAAEGDVEIALLAEKSNAAADANMKTKEVLETETSLHVGLTTAEVQSQLAIWGMNEVVTTEDPEWIKVVTRYLGLIPVMMLIVSILSAAIITKCDIDSVTVTDSTCQCTEARDWISFWLLLFELNLIVWADYLGEASSGNAIKELKKMASPTCHVMRDGEWTNIPKTELVPGDIVGLVIGACIPADGILRGDGPAEKFAPMKIDGQSVTGEALPETKRVGDSCLAGTTVLSGELEMQVTKTGERSTMGEAMKLISEVGEKGGKLKAMLGMIAKSVTLIGAIFCIAIFLVLVVRDEQPVPQAVKLAFVILVAVLPVAMPVVVTTGLAVGAMELSADKAIVQRLSAIEEMAGMDILCSDKTGTLTYGRMSIRKEDCVAFGDFSLDTLLIMSLLSSRRVNTDAIDSAVCNAFCDPNAPKDGGDKADPKVIKAAIAPYEEMMFDPFSPLTKRVSATIKVVSGKNAGESWIVAKGAPEVMNCLPGIDSETERKASEIVDNVSAKGHKTLGVCLSKDDGESWEMVGYLAIADDPRHDSKDTIEKSMALGVQVKMITGDQRKIAVEICRQLNLGKAVFGPEVWLPNSASVEQAGGIANLAELANGFASVKPKHKHKIVASLQEAGHTVGMTGDGVNDAPALKVANVGIAVQGATDAARGAADLVLTKPGLSTIVKAIDRSRMIFRRLEAYIVYRLASSITILGFFVLSICSLKFDFPTWTLILLSIINDFTVMATSKDNVRSSEYPLYWDMKKLLQKAMVIGFTCIIHTFLLLYFVRDASYSSNHGHQFIHDVGLGGLEDCEIVAVIYLTLAVSIQLNIFSSRNERFFWQTSVEDDAAPPPALLLVILVFGACILSTFLAVYWDENTKLGGGNPMKGCGWAAAGAVWVWCLVWFLIIEILKVFTNSMFDGTDGGVSDLFMSPLTRKFLRKLTGRGKTAKSLKTFGDSLRADATKLDVAAEHLNLQMNSSVASVIAASSSDDAPTVLSQMKNLEKSASTKDIVKVVNAMREHIYFLETRLREIDGMNVTENRLSLAASTSAAALAKPN